MEMSVYPYLGFFGDDPRFGFQLADDYFRQAPERALQGGRSAGRQAWEVGRRQGVAVIPPARIAPAGACGKPFVMRAACRAARAMLRLLR